VHVLEEPLVVRVERGESGDLADEGLSPGVVGQIVTFSR
jgi:hypothetical protein